MGSRAGSSFLNRHVWPPLAGVLIRALRASLVLRTHRRETLERFAAEGRRYVHVFWHAHILMMVYSYIGPRLVFMISRHRDGELIARTVERFGYVPSRGSTTTGGSAALREMIRAVRGGADIGFTPDGPRGPAREVQPGCVAAARALGIPIVPVALGASRAWRLNTWDGFIIPKPFSRLLLVYGDPLPIPREMSLEQGARQVKQALLDCERFAALHAGDRRVGVKVR